MNGDTPAEPLAAVQHRVGPRGHRRAGQHDHHRRADHLRHREALGRRRTGEVRRSRTHRQGRRGEPARHLGIRSDEAHDGIRQHGPPELRRRGVLRRRGSLPRTSSSSTTSRTAGCAMPPRCTSSTAWSGTQRGAKWITVQDCVSREPVSRRMGARRFTFALRGQLALVQRCHSDKGRHSFMTGQPTGSGNVFLDCRATSPFSSSEPHEQWATGTLYDNVQAPLTARFWKNINIGWAGANTVFWNCEGDFLVQKPPTAQNYSFGHIGRQRGRLQHPAAGHDQGERPHRVARPARHAAQPVPHAAARAAWRRGGPPDCHRRSARLTEPRLTLRPGPSSTTRSAPGRCRRRSRPCRC